LWNTAGDSAVSWSCADENLQGYLNSVISNPQSSSFSAISDYSVTSLTAISQALTSAFFSIQYVGKLGGNGWPSNLAF